MPPLGNDSSRSGTSYVAGNPISFVDPKGLDVLLTIGDNAAGIKSGRAIDLITRFTKTGNLSVNVPIYGPLGISASLKADGQDGAMSCYIGAGIVVGSSFSFAPRISPQLTVTGGDTAGFGYRINASTPGLIGPFGATGSISGTHAGGVTIQGGPAVVGGIPSVSATVGYTFKP